MFPEPQAHHLLWTAASLASGWPVFRALRAEESQISTLLQSVVAQVGAVPQAVIDVPNGDGAWRLELPLPNIEADEALLVTELGGWFTPGPRPTEAIAMERGLLWCTSRSLGGCLMQQWEGQPDPWLGFRGTLSVDAPVRELEAQLIDALRSVDPALQLQSDRGLDTIAGVRDVGTGRFGVWLSLADVPEPNRVLQCLADQVTERAAHDTLRLAPDVTWRPMLDGMDAILWAIAPAIPVPWPVPSHERVVLHIAADWERTVLEGARLMEALSWPAGAMEWRWAEGGWHFCPTWVADIEEGADTDEVVAALSVLGPVERVGGD